MDIDITDINEFHEEASPANILALVEALEKAQQYAKERDAENQDLMLTVGRLRVEREELESRTVKLPEPFKLAKSSSGLTYYYADEVNEALSAAGIKWEAE
ncbi:TPA: ead/Ea22-like family protein [Raoultella ornithinolytica]|nr:ead/Ea22-like family protein [Raoultella ornithinolytica]